MADNFSYSIGLNINADVRQAQHQLNQLKSQLNNLTANSIGTLDLSKNLNTQKAIDDVTRLSGILNMATDAAGNLDLAKFSQSLSQSKTNLTSYASSFRNLGIEGQKAFLQINASIASAEQPLIRVKGLLDNFIDQMIRTTKIQLSYSVLNSITGSFKHALNYAEKLDKTLTDIQIVTKQSTSDMEKFAKTANKAAKALSVSTTDYTKAALIFYQQGLSDEAVKERTDVTIKMANVSGEAASDISSYMTAIWNNFDDGSKSLEYYADVIAKLGADTAASNADIAEGMQAFAAVADTVGLSYEYATSALALLVDKTQQSSDIIGNSLKTIFARLESVSLGDTLDDDTNLTKYTKALETVGVTIQNTDGTLKDMDSILDDLGSKWEGLNEQQKMGLAYTVAGVRQYNNFISLMDNYDDYQRLIDSAKRSTGELNKEQEIYAQSWEAARDKVEAAAQGIYQSLLDDKFFKDLTNLFATLLNKIQLLTDGFGGMKGLLFLIGTLSTTIFKDKIVKGINVISQELYGLTSTGKREMKELQEESRLILQYPEKFGLKGFAGADSASVNAMSKKVLIQNQINEKADRLSEIQKAQLEQEVKSLDIISKKYEESAKILEITKKEVDLANNVAKSNVFNSMDDSGIKRSNGKNLTNTSKANVYNDINNLAEASAIGNYITDTDILDIQAYEDFVNKANENLNVFKTSQIESLGTVEQLIPKLKDLFAWVDEYTEISKKARDEEIKYRSKASAATGEEKQKYEQMAEKAKDEADAFSDLTQQKIQDSKELAKALKNVEELTMSMQDKSQIRRVLDKNKIKSKGKEADTLSSELRNQTQNSVKIKAQLYIDERELKDAENSLNQAVDNIQKRIDSFSPEEVRVLQDAFADLSSVVMQTGFLLSSIGSIIDTISNPDMTGWEKFKGIMASLISIVPTVISMTLMLTNAKKLENAETAMGLILSKSEILSKMVSTVQTKAKAAAEMLDTGALAGSTAATIAQTVANWALNASMAPLIIIILALVAAIGALVLAYQGIKKLIDWIQKQTWDAKIKAAAEETEKAAQAANDAADAYDNLIDTLDGLDNIYDKLNKLTAGTVEWQQAVLEANKQAKELIDTYGLQFGTDWTFDSNGVIRFTEKGQTKMKEDEYEKLKNANNALEGAKYNESNLKIQKAKEEIENTENLLGITSDFEYYQENKNKLLDSISSGKLDLKNNNWEQQLKDLEFNDYIIDLLKSNEGLRTTLQENGNIIKENSQIIKSELIPDIASGLVNDKEWNSLNETQKQDVLAKITEERAQDIENEIKRIEKNSELSQQAKEQYAITEGAYKEGNKWYVGEGDDKEEYKLSEIADAAIASMARANMVEQIIQEISNMSSNNLLSKANEAEKSRIYTEEQLNSRIDEFNYGDKNLDSEEVANYTEQLMKENKVLTDNAELARKIAVANMNYNDGLKDIIDNSEDYCQVLKDNNRLSEEFASTAKLVKDDLSRMFEVDADNISDDFITNADNIKLMELAARGDLNAIEDLRNALSDSIMASFELEDTQYKTQMETILSEIDALDMTEIEIGTSISDIKGTDKFLEILDQLMAAGALTADQVNDYLDSIGFEPEITYEKIELKAGETLQTSAYIKDAATGEMSLVEGGTTVQQGTQYYMPVINRKKTVARGSAPKITSNNNKNAASKNVSKSKNLNDERERYHVVNKELDALNSNLDKISAAKDRAFGNKRLALIDQEISKYGELIDKQKQYISEIQSNLSSDASIMKGYGAVIGADGTIQNYDDLIAKQVAAYNAAGGSDAAEENYENFKKALSNYEESVSLMQSAEKQLQDLIYEEYDTKLEGVQYRVEFKLEIEDADIEYLDFLMNLMDEDSYEVAEAIGMIAQQAEDTLSKIGTIEEGIAGIFNNHDLNGSSILASLKDGTLDISSLGEDFDLTANEIQQLRQWVNELQENVLNYKELQEKANQKVLDSFDAFTSKVDKQISRVEHLNSVLEHYQNIIDLVGKKTLGISDELYDKLQRTTYDLAKKQLQISQTEYETAKRAYEDAVAKGLDENTLSELKDRLDEVEENFMSNWETAIQQALDLLKDGLKDASDAFGESVSGIRGSLDELSNWYNKTSTQKNNYLENYEKIYNLTKMTRNIQDSIDNTDDIAGKKQLKSLMEEITELNNTDAKVSEYQLDTLQKRYELYQAEIALREAQNAKSQVRMVADSEGNMNYMYTADENAINSAQGNYEDALYAYAEANAKQLEDLAQKMLENRQKLAEEWDTLGGEDQERIQELLDWYSEQEAYYEEQMQLALDANIEVNGYTIASNWNVADEFKDTVYSQVSGFGTLAEVQDNWKKSTIQMAEDTAKAYQQFELDYKEVMSLAGTSTKDFADKVDIELGNVEKSAQDAADEVETMSGDFYSAFSDASDYAANFAKTYAGTAESVIKNTSSMIKEINKLIKTLAEVGGKNYNLGDESIEQITNAADAIKTQLNEGIKKVATTSYPTTESSGYVRVSTLGGKSVTDSQGRAYITGDSGDNIYYALSDLTYSTGSSRHSSYTYKAGTRYYTLEEIKKLDTGGYTGTWGNEGRWALLHQKELVLNAYDTGNILEAVNAARELADAVQKRSYGLEDILGKNNWYGGDLPNIEQQVIINAEFPDAVYQDEIRAAFDDLINRASQYANRK